MITERFLLHDVCRISIGNYEMYLCIYNAILHYSDSIVTCKLIRIYIVTCHSYIARILYFSYFSMLTCNILYKISRCGKYY